jgi:hypothetical protein
MTPNQLRAALARMGLSQRGAARLLNIDERTMRKYVAGDLVIPLVFGVDAARAGPRRRCTCAARSAPAFDR